MRFHVRIHAVYCFPSRLKPHIHEHSEGRRKLSAETVEKPIMRAELTRILVLDAHEQVHASLFSLNLLIKGLPALGIFFFFDFHVGQHYLLAKGPHVAQLFPGGHILIDEANGLIDGLGGDDLAFVRVIRVVLDDLLVIQFELTLVDALLLQPAQLVLLGHVQKEVLLHSFRQLLIEVLALAVRLQLQQL